MIKDLKCKMKSKTNIEFENRLVVFIDILGFREIIKKADKNPDQVSWIYDVMEFLKTLEKPDGWKTDFVEIEESAQHKGVENFEIKESIQCTMFSDSILVSVKVSPEQLNEATSTLISNLAYVGSILIQADIFWRGGMTYGNLIHTSNGIAIGQGLIDAYKLESNEAKFPRIVLTKKILDKLNYPLNSKSDRYPFHQYLYRHEDGLVGFHQLTYFEVVKDYVDGNTESYINSLKRAKWAIINGLDDNFESAVTFEKYTWLKDRYNRLYIDESVRTKIYELNEGISGNNISYAHTNKFFEQKHSA